MSDLNSAEILELPVPEIGPGPLVRTDRIDIDHATLLIPMLDLVPPVIVRETGNGWSLIDGQHRLSAHKLDGRKTIRAVVVALDDAEALEAAIKANTSHGKALTMDERKAAATQLIGSTDWSDRRIADACGIHRSTVAKLRPGCPGGGTDHLDTPRSGADGKDYPSPAVAKLQRERAVDAYAADPTLSVRGLAAKANCSKGIAESVIAQALAPEDPAPPVPPDASPASGEPGSGNNGPPAGGPDPGNEPGAPHAPEDPDESHATVGRPGDGTVETQATPPDVSGAVPPSPELIVADLTTALTGWPALIAHGPDAVAAVLLAELWAERPDQMVAQADIAEFLHDLDQAIKEQNT